jgi:hypothetical protein
MPSLNESVRPIQASLLKPMASANIVRSYYDLIIAKLPPGVF